MATALRFAGSFVLVATVLQFGSLTSVMASTAQVRQPNKSMEMFREPGPPPYLDGMQRWTPRTSPLLTRYLVRPEGAWRSLDESRNGDPVALESPDGSRFFYMAVRASTATDGNDLEVYIFSMFDVAHALRSGAAGPLKSACKTAVTESGNRPFDGGVSKNGIPFAEWIGNGAAIRFTASNKKLYELNAESCRIRLVDEFTLDGKEADGLAGYGHEGGQLYFVNFAGRREFARPYPLYALSDELLKDLTSVRPGELVKTTAFAAWQAQKPWRLPGKSYDRFHQFMENGRLILVRGRDGCAGCFEYAIVDVKRKSEHLPFDAPIDYQTGVDPAVLSIDGGRKLVFVDQIVPKSMDISDAGKTAIMAYDLVTRTSRVLELMNDPGSRARVSGVSKLNSSSILVRHDLDGKGTNATVYEYRNRDWSKSTQRETSIPESRDDKPSTAGAPVKLPAEGVSIVLRQGVNTPPAVVASGYGRELVLSSPDAALKGTWLAPASKVKWVDQGGAEHVALLRLPRQFPVGGDGVPLVIQLGDLGGDWEARFEPDGIGTTAYAAQSIVARGMAVVNMGPDVQLSAGNVPAISERIDNLAETIARQYPIDLKRVGLVGFSFYGFLARYATTHPGRIVPRAAVVADSFAHTFGENLVFAATGQGSHYDDPTFGGSFYENKSGWFARETSLNVDKVKTPTLFLANAELPIYQIETVGSFTLAKRPFDFIIFPEDSHNLWHPRARQASMQATADWMSFWLQNEERSSADDPDRLNRWRVQRDVYARCCSSN